MTDPKLFRQLLMVYQHNLDNTNQVDLFAKLKPFGQLANNAMQKYMASAPSPWFDWAHLMKMLRNEIAAQEGLPLVEGVWGQIVNIIGVTDPYSKPSCHPLIQEVITALGGVRNLRESTMDGPNRAKAQDTYRTLLDNYITEVITTKWK